MLKNQTQPAPNMQMQPTRRIVTPLAGARAALIRMDTGGLGYAPGVDEGLGVFGVDGVGQAVAVVRIEGNRRGYAFEPITMAQLIGGVLQQLVAVRSLRRSCMLRADEKEKSIQQTESRVVAGPEPQEEDDARQSKYDT